MVLDYAMIASVHIMTGIMRIKGGCMSNSFIQRVDDLTKREQFAIHAMSAYIAGNFAYSGEYSDETFPHPEEAAEQAVKYADALLEELEKKKDKS